MRRLLLEKERDYKLLSQIKKSQENGSLTSGAIFVLELKSCKREMVLEAVKECGKQLKTF